MVEKQKTIQELMNELHFLNSRIVNEAFELEKLQEKKRKLAVKCKTSVVILTLVFLFLLWLTNSNGEGATVCREFIRVFLPSQIVLAGIILLGKLMRDIWIYWLNQESDFALWIAEKLKRKIFSAEIGERELQLEVWRNRCRDVKEELKARGALEEYFEKI